MSTSTVITPPPAEFLARAVAFGLLVVGGIAAIVVAGAWWAACIAALGLLCAVAGLVVSALALASDEQAAAAWSGRSVALALGALAVAAIVVAVTAG